MKKMTIIVMIVTVIAKLFGFFRDKAITNLFGAGAVSDAFTFAYSLPSMLFTVVTATLVTGFIPMYARVRRENKERANDFVNNVFNLLNITAFILGVLLLLVPELLVKVAAPGFEKAPETFSQAVLFVRIMSFSIVGMAISQLGTGYLNVHQSFVVPNLISIPSNLVIIACTYIAARTGNTSIMAIGALVGYAMQGAIIFYFMKIANFKYRFSLNLKDENLRQMIILAIPLLLSALISTGNDLFTRSFATKLYDEGAYTYISYAARLQGFATGLFVTGILSVAYPTITKAAVENDHKKIVSSINDAILLISLFILPAMVGFTLLSKDIVYFVYFGDKFTMANVLELAPIFVGYATGILFVGLRDLFTRIHYAYQDMKRPLIAAVLYIVSNVIFCYILGPMFGLMGLTFANTIASLVAMLYLMYSTKRMIGNLELETIVPDLIKIVIASVLMGATLLILSPILNSFLSQRIALLGTIVVAVIVYGVSILVLRVNIVNSMLKRK